MKTGRNRIAVALGLGVALLAAQALAHGDVTPHPVDTKGLPALGKEWKPADPYRGNALAVEKGSVGYLHNCAGCHGLKAVSGGMAPDLLAAEQECQGMAAKPDQDSCLKDTDSAFKDIVLEGKKNSEGRVVMPAYGGVFTQEAVWAVKAYIDSRAAEEGGK